VPFADIFNYEILTFRMKKILVLVLFSTLVVTLFGCKESPKEIYSNKQNYSKTQQYLFDLLDNYKSEYFAAKKQELKDTIQSIYLEKLYHYLSDTLGDFIDSMNVTVDTVIQEGRLVTTQFHTRNIQFKYGIRFLDSMNSKQDSIYHWMLDLKPKSNLTVNFIHLGSTLLHSPDDTTVPTVKIYAFPEPLDLRP